MHWRMIGERSPALEWGVGKFPESIGKFKREPALFSCQAEGSSIPPYNGICLLPLLLPLEPAMEASEAETCWGWWGRRRRWPLPPFPLQQTQAGGGEKLWVKIEIWITVVSWSYLLPNWDCLEDKVIGWLWVYCSPGICLSFHSECRDREAVRLNLDGHWGKRMDLFSMASPYA